MGKPQSHSGLVNVISYDTNGNISFVSGSTTLMSVSSSKDITTTGKITATTLVVQTITSSISSITGSTNFGSLASNTHQFTGSMLVTGSVTATEGNFLGGGVDGSLGSVVRISTTNTNGNARNWALVNTFDSYGDLNFRLSTAQGGNALTAGSTILTLSRTGNALFTGQIKTTYAGQSISIDGGSTASVRMQLQNTSGNAGVTVESSTGGDQFTGTTAYAMAIGTYTARNFFIGTNSVQRLMVGDDGRLVLPYQYSWDITGGTTRTMQIRSDGLVGYITSLRASKANIISIETSNWLNQLNPVNFNYRKRDEDNNYTNDLHSELEYGLIAEEVEAINSDMVFYDIKEDGSKELRGVSYEKLIIPILRLVQEQQIQIQSLQEQINILAK